MYYAASKRKCSLLNEIKCFKLIKTKRNISKIPKPVCRGNKEDKNVESNMQKFEYNTELQTTGERARCKSNKNNPG